MAHPGDANAERFSPPIGERAAAPLTVIAIVVVVVAALYLGREIFIPFALAMALAFALVPLETRLRRLGLGRIPGVIVVVALAFSAIGGLGILVGGQLFRLAENLPTYQQNIQTKIRSLRSEEPNGGLVDRVARIVDELGSELSKTAAPPPGPAVQAEAKSEAVPVRIEGQTSPLQVFREMAEPLLAPLVSAGLVLLFMVFMLLGHSELRDRLIRLLGGGNLHLTTEALDEAASRVSRYLLAQLAVNSAFGVLIGLGLFFIGVPNAVLWGALAAALRFIPFLGPILGAVFPVVLAIAVAPGWDLVLWTVALFVSVELVTGNVIEPWLYGVSAGVSSLAIIVGAIFWTTLWGIPGLFLSTPLTVCVAVIGRYIPQLRFLDVVLGTEPVLRPEERFYQRMLAGNPEEGEEVAESFLEERPLLAFYDDVVLPALRMAERDRQRSALGRDRRSVLTESFLEVVAQLGDYEDPAPEEAGGPAAGTPAGSQPPAAAPGPAWAGPPVLCSAGRTGLDFVAATILAQLLVRQGIPARALPVQAQGPDGIAGLAADGVELVCLSYLSTAAFPHVRQAARRFQRHLPRARLMVGLWSLQLGEDGDLAATGAVSPDLIVRSFADAVDRIKSLSAAPAQAPAPAAAAPEAEEERLEELRKLELLDTEPEERFDDITARLAGEFQVPISLLTLIDETRQFWKSSAGLPDDLAMARQASREAVLCGRVVAEKRPLVIEDALGDPDLAASPFVRERGIRFYAGAPLRTRTGHAIGTVCVMDTKPRTISERERALLQVAAEDIMAAIENRRSAHDPPPAVRLKPDAAA
jgi:predicted PurR-regulated permease PerM